MNEHEYERAITAFEALGDYNDSKDKISECKYNIANNLMSEGKYDEAIAVFQALGDYKDSIDIIIEYLNATASNLMKEGKYAEIVTLLDGLGDYNDGEDKIAECRYKIANELAEKGQYNEAIAVFEPLGDYKDSVSKAKTQLIKSKTVGDTLYFGSYEQDNNTSNGKEEIEWIVLDKTQKSILLISKYALASMPYDELYYTDPHTELAWEKSSLRKWLNSTFLGAAFSREEQAQIIAKSLDDGCIDKVFLLSEDEVGNYFGSNYGSNKARQCVATDYATANGAPTSGKDSTGAEFTSWWLRWGGKPGASTVKYDGSFDYWGDYYYREGASVRPAIWINLDS